LNVERTSRSNRAHPDRRCRKMIRSSISSE
jgi:hypothetical protein